MIENPLLPDWDGFERNYIAGGIPCLFIVRPYPQVSIFLDQGAARFGLRFGQIPENSWTGANTLVEVRIAEVLLEGARYLEVSTNARELYRNFYGLAVEVVDAVVERNAEPVSALSTAIACWDALLTRPALLSEEAQAGLFGELWLVERLLAVRGPSAIDAWVGPHGHAHDFRIEENEIEVKTTTSNRRIHTINGTGQLQPSLGSALYLLSLKLTDGGTGGRMLGELVMAIAEQLTSDAIALDGFWKRLERVRYREMDSSNYPRKRKLRDVPVLVPIVDGVPRLTQVALAGLSTSFASHRIGHVVYDIDITGLGVEDGSPEFNNVIPSLSSDPENPFHV